MKKLMIALCLGLLLCLSAVFMTGYSCSCGSDNTPPDWDEETISGVTYSVFEDHYYLFVEGNLTWYEAEMACESKGGHLATITSWDEDYVVRDLIGDGRHVWLGATDEETEGTWKWVTGEEFDYKDWLENEPNGSTNENYLGFNENVELYDYGWNDYGWNDGQISGYVCEWESKNDIGKAQDLSSNKISTVEDLKNLANKNGIYLLENDIDLSGESNWTPIVGFKGILDGQNHTIKNLTIDSLNNVGVGLFATVNGTVKNLTIENAQITAVGNAGLLGAVAGTNYGKIDNVTVTGNINAPYYSYVGGIVGLNNCGKVMNSVNKANITAHSYIGGVIGNSIINSNGAINGNKNQGDIIAIEYVGGISGGVTTSEVEGTYTYAISGCENSGNVTVSKGRVGGIFGRIDAIDRSYVEFIEGDLSWNNIIQGNFDAMEDKYINHTIQTYFTVADCKNSGTITAPTDHNSYDAGGVLGYGSRVTTLSNCENTGNITGGTSVGGFVGYSPNTNIKANGFVNTATITGNGRVGGIAGHSGLIENATNEGEIISLKYIIEKDAEHWSIVGGVAGYATGIVSCENKSDIIVAHDGKYVGGVVGYLYLTTNRVEGNKNSGEISGYGPIGGVIGCVGLNVDVRDNTFNVTTSENSGNITSMVGSAGGVIGCSETDSNWLTLNTLTNTGNVTGSESYNDVGGIIGLGTRVSSIQVCKNTGNITGGVNVGGIAGYAPDAIISATGIPQTGNISGRLWVGGFAGTAKIVEDAINHGTVSASGQARAEGWLCEFVALGGIVGHAKAVLRCENTADILYIQDGRGVGGIVGVIYDAPIEDCLIGNKNSGNIQGCNDVGGIAGHIEGGSVKIDKNVNSGKIVGNYRVAGIVGEVYNWSFLITGCSNTGVIEGNNYFGGIAGKHSGINMDEYYFGTNSTTQGELLGKDITAE